MDIYDTNIVSFFFFRKKNIHLMILMSIIDKWFIKLKSKAFIFFKALFSQNIVMNETESKNINDKST